VSKKIRWLANGLISEELGGAVAAPTTSEGFDWLNSNVLPQRAMFV
jgi:hypothetical protein